MDEIFYQTVLNHFDVTAEKPRRLPWAVDNKQEDYRTRAASVTRKIDALAQDGNPAAGSLFDQAAADVIRSIESVLRRSGNTDPYTWKPCDSGLNFHLVLSGGLFRKQSPLTLRVTKLLEANPRILTISLPTVPAVQSAASIALYQNGYPEAAESVMNTHYE